MVSIYVVEPFWIATSESVMRLLSLPVIFLGVEWFCLRYCHVRGSCIKENVVKGALGVGVWSGFDYCHIRGGCGNA
jgi:hypothetical protein